MKLKYPLLAIIAGAAFTMAADSCEIPMTIASANEGTVVSRAVASQLDNKLKTILTRYGVAGSYDSQFFITGRFDTGFSERTSGPTQAEYVNTTVTLFIGDAEGKKIFSSLTLDLKGAGQSVNQAYTKAINSINVNRDDFRNFLESGKEKIIDYYNSHYKSILQKAQTAVSKREYGEAMYYATQIPECCKGFPEAQSLITQAHTSMVNYEAEKLLAQAEAAWAADPTDTGARDAYGYITQIDPASPAYARAKALSQKIEKTVKANWDFENIQKYKDQLEIEKMRQNNRAANERARIEAARAVGVAWAKSRPTKVVYNYRGWY